MNSLGFGFVGSEIKFKLDRGSVAAAFHFPTLNFAECRRCGERERPIKMAGGVRPYIPPWG